MSERYAICCKGCGHVEDKAWKPATGETHSYRMDGTNPNDRSIVPLTPQGHVPIYCQKCGQRNWQRPALKEQIEKWESKIRAEQRATELTAREDFDGVFKIPDEFSKAAPEVKRALANLLGPLDGDVLKSAQQNLVKVARSGMQGDALAWIDYCDRAVARALPNKQTAKA